MTPQVARLVKAFDVLPPAEKADFIAFIAKRQSASGPGLTVLNEEFRKAQTINFAPGPGSCPTCGK